MKYVIRFGAVAAFFLYAAAQIAAGYEGILHAAGLPWALAAILLAITLRFTLPLTVGAYLGATEMWGWHWALALLFCVPGLFCMLPGALSAIFSLAGGGAANLTRATPVCDEH